MRIHRYLASAVIIGLCSATASAEEPPTLNGKWLLTFPARNGSEFAGYLTVSDGDAKWRSIARTQAEGKNPCFGHDFPVTLASGDASGTTLSVNESATMPGCYDFTLKATSTDGKEWSGAMDDGRPVRFVRQ